MDLYFDENFSHFMASAINELEKAEERNRVFHTTRTEGMYSGMPDEELIPLIGQRRGILMTKDKKITTRSAQFGLLKEHNVSAFFFSTPQMGHWDQMLAIMKQWQALMKKARDLKMDRERHYFTVKARGEIVHWEIR